MQYQKLSLCQGLLWFHREAMCIFPLITNNYNIITPWVVYNFSYKANIMFSRG